jgi:hypothetical protein
MVEALKESSAERDEEAGTVTLTVPPLLLLLAQEWTQSSLYFSP